MKSVYVNLRVPLPTAVWKLLCTWIRPAPCRAPDAHLVEAAEVSPRTTGSTGYAVLPHWEMWNAKDKAKRLRIAFTDRRGSLDLRALADYEGAIITYEGRGKPMYFDRVRERYVITMPHGTSQRRDAYAIAADIGRLVLVLPLEDREDPAVKNRNLRLCSMFAAELLLPEDEVRKCMANGDNHYAIASRFGVLPSAAAIRMYILSGGKEGGICP